MFYTKSFYSDTISQTLIKHFFYRFYIVKIVINLNFYTMKKINLLLFSLIILLMSCESNEQKSQKKNLEKDENNTICTFDLLQMSNNTKSKPNAAITNWKWKTGQTIKIKFLDGNIEQQEKVKKFANEWTIYANLKFEYVDINEYADIKIGFNLFGPNNQGGAWSRLGAEAAYTGQNTQTMRLGPLTATNEDTNKRTVLHEFGHALGLFHETTNPAANINWDFPKTYQYYSLQFTKDEVDRFIINKENTTDFSEYDPLSIMHYYIPASITTNGVAVYEQSTLSQIDKKSIAGWYPYPTQSIIKKGERIDKIPFTRFVGSQNGLYALNFKDGILRIIEVDNQKIIWEAGTFFGLGSSAALEDGNLYIRKDTKTGLKSTIWRSSNFLYNGPCNLELQNDGNLILFHDGIQKWSSKAGQI